MISYKHFLYGAITFSSLLMALAKAGLLSTASWGLLGYWAGSLYFTFLIWAIGQLYRIHSREKRQAELEGAGGGVPLSAEEQPAESALVSAETYLSLGEDLETVCAFVNEDYRLWNAAKRQAFRQNLIATLSERRAKAAGHG